MKTQSGIKTVKTMQASQSQTYGELEGKGQKTETGGKQRPGGKCESGF